MTDLQERIQRPAILVAEDSRTQAEQLKHLLEEGGYDVAVTRNGREALAEARRRRPALLLSDIRMPEMDGYTLCEKIKSDPALQALPVVLLTSLSGAEEVMKALQCGADNFLTKPYDGKHLLSRIRQILANQELRQQGKVQLGIEIYLGGHKYFVGAERQQMLDLLISSYEEAIRASTELRKRTADLAEANRQLELRNQEVERAGKFKDQFLSTMSHELRTPLNAVLGFSELLADERYGPLNERQHRYLSHVQNAGQHLLRLINDILDLSRIEAGRVDLYLENVPLETTFAEILDVMRPLAEKKAQGVAQDCQPGLAVRADSTRLKQVLMNLLGNAIKFTPPEGRIEARARRQDGLIRIEVRDNGPGIPPEERKKIFEAFYRLRASGQHVEGTGLGLVISQRLVELQGGKLEVESQAGQGSTFFFSLPPATIIQEAVRQEGPTHAPAKSRILVIEDEPTSRQLIESQLVSAGYEVVLCRDPEQAAQIADEVAPDAIALDILMQPVSGWEVLAKLKSNSRTAKIPVVVVTILDEPGVGALLGADEYMVKPVQRDLLLAAVRRCLRKGKGEDSDTHILVVEDDAAARESLIEFLSNQGYRAEAAKDGAEARKRIASSVPDLVILDLGLPKVSGFELLAEWRANPATADVPVFVLTGKNLTPEEEQMLRSHTELLLQKGTPWQQRLVEQLRRVLNRDLQNA